MSRRLNKTAKLAFYTARERKGDTSRLAAASVERIEAFIKLGRPDPVAYAYTMDNGDIIPVPWKVAKAHVESVLAEYSK